MKREKIGTLMAVSAASAMILAGFLGPLSGERSGIWQPKMEVLASKQTSVKTAAVSVENTEGETEEQGYKAEDYEYLLSLKPENSESVKVKDYNKQVLDWEDEEAYHKTEDILHKVYYKIGEEDPNYGFFKTTLANTWEECSVLHYNACHRKKPSYSGSISREKHGDIYGDDVVLAGAYADFCFNYDWNTISEMTVAQRDAAFENIRDKMQEALDEADESELQNEEKMEKLLGEKLAGLKAEPGCEFMEAEDTDLGYYYVGYYGYGDMSDGEWSYNSCETGSNSGEGYSTQLSAEEQYDLVFQTLMFPDYKTMTVSEFNRRVNSIFNGDEADNDFWKAYENVMMTLEDSGQWTEEEADFLKKTVPAALAEYSARAIEVYSGNAGNLKEQEVWSVIEAAGAEASTDKILFTDCSLGYIDIEQKE